MAIDTPGPIDPFLFKAIKQRQTRLARLCPECGRQVTYIESEEEIFQREEKERKERLFNWRLASVLLLILVTSFLLISKQRKQEVAQQRHLETKYLKEKEEKERKENLRLIKRQEGIIERNLIIQKKYKEFKPFMPVGKFVKYNNDGSFEECTFEEAPLDKYLNDLQKSPPSQWYDLTSPTNMESKFKWTSLVEYGLGVKEQGDGHWSINEDKLIVAKMDGGKDFGVEKKSGTIYFRIKDEQILFQANQGIDVHKTHPPQHGWIALQEAKELDAVVALGKYILSRRDGLSETFEFKYSQRNANDYWGLYTGPYEWNLLDRNGQFLKQGLGHWYLKKNQLIEAGIYLDAANASIPYPPTSTEMLRKLKGVLYFKKHHEGHLSWVGKKLNNNPLLYPKERWVKIQPAN